MTLPGPEPKGDPQNRLPAVWLTLAQISVVVSIMGFFVLPLMTLAGAVIACVAGTISVAGWVPRTRGPAAVCLVLGLCFLAFTGMMISPTAHSSGHRAKAWRIEDTRRLRAIGDALIKFRGASGRWPRDLGELVESEYLEDAGVLVCPGQPYQRRVTAAEARNGNCGYIYFGGSDRPLPTFAGEEVLACTKPGVLDMPGILERRFWSGHAFPWQFRKLRNDGFANVLFADGHARGFVGQPAPLSQILATRE